MFLSRREIIRGITVSLVTGCSCGSKCAVPAIYGCSINADAARGAIFGQSNSTNIEDFIVKNSGNRYFDFTAAQTLLRLAELFNVLPGFGYFKLNSRNAFATRGDFMSRTDGTVLFGRDLLFEILSTTESPDAVFSGICAHEFAHILQFKLNLSLDAGQQTVKRSELHADFLAGYFAGFHKREKPDFPAAVIAVEHQSLGDYYFNNPNHHGTPDERAAAIVHGFEVAYRDRAAVTQAIAIGVDYVSKL